MVQVLHGDTTGNVSIAEKPTINIADWSSTGGIVEISTLSGYTTQYRVGLNGKWLEYNGQVDVVNGETIFARYANGDEMSQAVSKVVSDTNGPKVTISEPVVNGGEISISVTAIDEEMGMPTPPTYDYYIKKASESFYATAGHNTTGEFTYTNLDGFTQYDIRVITNDLAGNQGVATTGSQTQSTDNHAPTINLTA